MIAIVTEIFPVDACEAYACKREALDQGAIMASVLRHPENFLWRNLEIIAEAKDAQRIRMALSAIQATIRRDEGLALLRERYLGPDVYGVGVNLPPD